MTGAKPEEVDTGPFQCCPDVGGSFLIGDQLVPQRERVQNQCWGMNCSPANRRAGRAICWSVVIVADLVCSPPGSNSRYYYGDYEEKGHPHDDVPLVALPEGFRGW